MVHWKSPLVFIHVIIDLYFFKPKLQILFGPQFWEDLFRIEVGLPLRHGKTKNWNIDDNNNFYNLSWLWQLVSYMLKRYFQLKFKRKLLRNICCNIENHCRMFLKIIIIKRETIVILFKKFEYFVFIWSASKAVFYIKQCIWSFVVKMLYKRKMHYLPKTK